MKLPFLRDGGRIDFSAPLEPFALVPDACRRPGCDHPIGQHSDRAVVACHGDPSLAPTTETWREPNCRCIGEGRYDVTRKLGNRCEWCGETCGGLQSKSFCSDSCERAWLREDRNAEMRAEAADDAYMDTYGPEDVAATDDEYAEMGGD